MHIELGLESLKDRKRLRELCFLYNTVSTKLPSFLYEIVPAVSHRYPGCFEPLRCRAKLLQNSVLPFTVSEWNKLDREINNVDY